MDGDDGDDQGRAHDQRSLSDTPDARPGATHGVKRASGERSLPRVLMDCEMPEMDGYEATRRIRQAEPLGRQVPIIAVTARVQPEDRERCLAVGMNEYLTKPICAYDLAVALERWVRAIAC